MWQIAIVLDKDDRALTREMPVWALETAARLESADEFRRAVAGFWSPEPAFTLFSAGGETAPLKIVRGVVGTVLEHHPCATRLDLIGIAASKELEDEMLLWGFEAAGDSEDGLLFRKPISKLGAVPNLVMDAHNWTTWDDLYTSFFRAVGAPDWHGKNFNALYDSIEAGGINKIEVPYTLVITNLNHAGPEANVAAQTFIELIREMESKGCPISVVIRS